MQKPNSYDDVKVGGDFTPIALGGHRIVIKNVDEGKSKKGNNMLTVYFDFAPDDKQPGYFTEQFKNDVRPDKKWPRGGTAYVVCEDDEGKCHKQLKGFITSFEESNKTEVVWGDKFTIQFKNKRIGGVYGEKENEWNGKTTLRHELRWFCSVERADSAAIPDPILLDKPKKPDDGFMDITNDSDQMPWG